MALINCSECEKQISDKAESCNGCGAPLEKPKPEYAYTDKNGNDRKPFEWEAKRDGVPMPIGKPQFEKSLAGSLLLTVLLGPFGLCYVNTKLGLILGIIWLILIITLVFMPLAFFPYVAAIVLSCIDIDRYNQGLPVTFE